jgi:polyisoprenoid-binding protein YceI
LERSKTRKGPTRIGLEGKLSINRKDYGIGFNAALEKGVAMVGKEVSIKIDIEANRQDEEQ